MGFKTNRTVINAYNQLVATQLRISSVEIYENGGGVFIILMNNFFFYSDV